MSDPFECELMSWKFFEKLAKKLVKKINESSYKSLEGELEGFARIRRIISQLRE